MSDESGAPGRFRTSLRGYDREQVDAAIADLEERITALERERSALAAALGDGGTGDLGAEIDAVTAEIGRILHAAHEASENMRRRAEEDAATWRNEAQSEAQHTRQEARDAAEHARGDAWKTGTELLAQAQAEAAAILHQAEQEGLAARAAAEREASRHVAEARRDLEEQSRQARMEADRVTAEARQSAEQLVRQATGEAEAAQERARALEERRASLMAELETAQQAIGKVEADLEERKQALARVGDMGTVRVLAPGPTEADEPEEKWFDEDETVRVVRSDTVLAEPEPIDADAFVAELEQQRQAQRRRTADPRPAPAVEPAPPGVAIDGEPVAAEPEPEPQPAAVEPEPVAVEPEPASPPSDPAPAAPPEPAPAEQFAPGLSDIDELFSRLRSGPVSTPPLEVASAPAATATAVVTAPDSAPLDVRDRLLLPVTNAALREVKRALVELQNVSLEGLRTEGPAWRPDEAALAEPMAPTLREMSGLALGAGYSGAAELANASTVPSPAGVEAPDPTGDVAGALWREVTEVAERAEAAGTSERQSAAAVSKVFRTWRTDGAERWVRAAAFAAYHEGVLRGLAELGIDTVTGVPEGRLCAECPAARPGTTWDPSGDTPEGTGIPPVQVDCMCTVAPG